jgi:hypothetical protein
LDSKIRVEIHLLHFGAAVYIHAGVWYHSKQGNIHSHYRDGIHVPVFRGVPLIFILFFVLQVSGVEAALVLRSRFGSFLTAMTCSPQIAIQLHQSIGIWATDSGKREPNFQHREQS